jgi:hypothetical protein
VKTLLQRARDGEALAAVMEEMPELAPPPTKQGHKNYALYLKPLRKDVCERVTFSSSPLAVLPYDSAARRRAKIVLPEYCAVRKGVGTLFVEQMRAKVKALRNGITYTLRALDFVTDVDLAARAALKTQPQLLKDFKLVFEQEATAGDAVHEYASANARNFGTILELLGQELRKRNIISVSAYLKSQR